MFLGQQSLGRDSHSASLGSDSDDETIRVGRDGMMSHSHNEPLLQSHAMHPNMDPPPLRVAHVDPLNSLALVKGVTHRDSIRSTHSNHSNHSTHSSHSTPSVHDDDIVPPMPKSLPPPHLTPSKTPFTRYIPSHEYDLVQKNLSLLKSELKIVSNDRDRLKEELQKSRNAKNELKLISKERDTLKEELLKEKSSHFDHYKQASGRSGMESHDVAHMALVQSKCDNAMYELEAVKQKYAETEEKSINVNHEKEYLKQKNSMYMTKIERLQEELSQSKSQYGDAMNKKKRLEQEVLELNKAQDGYIQDIELLRNQQREVINESGSSEVLNKISQSALDKYWDIKPDYDSLRKRYNDLVSEYTNNIDKMALIKEERDRQVGRFNEKMQEMEAYKKQCTEAIRNWHSVTNEKNEVEKKVSKISEELRLEVNQSKLLKQDLAKVTKERHKAIQEYHLVMSERSTVHKELENLQGQLDSSLKTNSENQSEIKKLEKKVTSLEQEIQTILKDRDEATNKYTEMKKKYEDISNQQENAQKERDVVEQNFAFLSQECDVAKRERQEALAEKERILRETYQQRHEFTDAHSETDWLRKQVAKLESEIKDSYQEVQNAQDSRDWAFDERDKIVQERESIRTLCDKLRRERDKAVSEQMGALRDLDELKKQKQEAMKDAKEYKERYTAMMDKENRKNMLNSVGQNHSRDSAIDTDMQEWETETLEFNIGSKNQDDIGFNLIGGTDSPQFPNDNSIFVSSVMKGSVADGKLKVNDQVLKVNNIDVTNVEKKTAIQAVRNTRGGVINMVVRRRRSSSKSVIPVQLNTMGEDLGVSIEQGFYISKISPGSPAARDNNLAIGDRIININGRNVEQISLNQVKNLIQDNTSVVLNVQKFLPSPFSPVSSLGSPGPGMGNHLQSPSPTINSPHQVQSDLRSPLNSSLWSPPGESTLKMAALKNLKSSGSQTDSLDNPENSPRDKPRKMPNSHDILSRIFKTKNKDAHKKSDKAIENLPGEDYSVELEAVLAQHYPSDSHSKEKHRKSRDHDNSGTWPKYRGPPTDFTDKGTITVPAHKKKERIPLHEVQFQQPNTNYNNAKHSSPWVQQLAPVPPVRHDSFHYIKHSPQNSDVSTTTSQHKSTSYLPSSSKQQQVRKKSTAEEKQLRGLRYESHSSSHVSTSSTPDTSSDFLNYPIPTQNQKSSNRPFSAPSRRQQERAHKRHEGYPPKPDSLNVQPVYRQKSPSSTLPRSLSGTPHSDHGFSPRTPSEKSSSGHLSYSNSSSYSHYSSPIPQQALRFTPPAVPSYIAPGQRSLPPSGGIVSPPLPFMASTPPGTTGRHSSPPGFYAGYVPPLRSMNSSIPEIETLEKPPAYQPPRGHRSISPASSRQSSGLDRGTPTPSEEYYKYSRGRSTPDSATDTTNFAKKVNNERIRIPSISQISSASKSSRGNISAGSFERVSMSDRSSPISPYPGDMSSTGSLPRPTITVTPRKRKRPQIGECREITIEKSCEALGIQIQTRNGGVFVSNVVEGSLAQQACMTVGDQILDVCGVNLRNANQEHATRVMQGLGDNITMKVQYNPKKYTDSEDSASGDVQSVGSSSIVNSPSHNSEPHRISNETLTSATPTNTPRHSAQPSLNDGNMMICEEPRFVFLKKTSTTLGIGLIGGNLTGIFVHEVHKDSIASGHNGLRCGDQILEFNGNDIRNASAEQAAIEICKPSQTVSILAQYNPAKYSKIKDQHCDSFYTRALTDHSVEVEGDLAFKKDDILYVDNTLFNGKSGLWRAWLVDSEGKKGACGTIPSKMRMEQELYLKRSLSDSIQEDELKSASSRRSTASARRSFFRRKKHQRNNSKDSRDLPSFSDASINSDSLPILDDVSTVAYQKVERLDSKVCRPVLILAPLAESLISKLILESPDKFQRCETEIARASEVAMQKGEAEGIWVDYQRKGSHYECLTIASVKEILNVGKHCLIDCSPMAVERLHRAHIYPIVLFVKHKSPKQIREVKDTRFLPEKVTNKSAKEMFEHFQKLEQDYKHIFSEIIQGGNLAYMFMQIKKSIDIEQRKTIWLPSGSL
ncbi:unnamed protein product [Owenia fusiformis]|uniref:Uncharacterized protein n=1 Tax=Owenia fusiformis TaxID=6347 RepID=A0A8J1UKM6_OWEFU|nr:unnamed protein product [Owenia fusiformis]